MGLKYRFDSFARRRLRHWFEFVGSARYSRPGLDGLDRRLAKYLDYRGGYYIEAGANDGYSQSNTYYLERFRGWSGVLIEPVPALFERCCRERARSKVFNCALIDREDPRRTVTIHYADLMSFVHGSFENVEQEKARVNEAMRVQALRSTYTVEVPAQTMTDVLVAAAAPRRIDFLSLDVEGVEASVLRGLDLERFQIDFILVETRFSREAESILAERYDVADSSFPHDLLLRRR